MVTGNLGMVPGNQEKGSTINPAVYIFVCRSFKCRKEYHPTIRYLIKIAVFSPVLHSLQKG